MIELAAFVVRAVRESEADHALREDRALEHRFGELHAGGSGAFDGVVDGEVLTRNKRGNACCPLLFGKFSNFGVCNSRAGYDGYLFDQRGVPDLAALTDERNCCLKIWRTLVARAIPACCAFGHPVIGAHF